MKGWNTSTLSNNDSDGEPGETPEDSGAAVARLFRAHNRVLIGFLAVRLRSEHEAQEVAQEAYVKLLQLEHPSAVSFLRAYLFRVAENLALDRLKHRNHVVRHVRSQIAGDPLFGRSVEEEAAAEQELTLLKSVVAELPPRCREAFRMHRLENLSTAEIAAALGVTERMVRKYVARSLIYARLRLDGLSAEQAWERCAP